MTADRGKPTTYYGTEIIRALKQAQNHGLSLEQIRAMTTLDVAVHRGIGVKRAEILKAIAVGTLGLTPMVEHKPLTPAAARAALVRRWKADGFVG